MATFRTYSMNVLENTYSWKTRKWIRIIGNLVWYRLRLSRTRHFIIMSFCRFYLSIIQTSLALSCLTGAFSLFSFCVYNPTFKVVEKVFRFSKSKVCCSRFLEKTAFFQKEKIMRDSFPSCFLFTCLGKISWNHWKMNSIS